MRNLELKVRVESLEPVRQLARALGAVPDGVLLDTDTYFRTNAGRLKLREATGEGGTAILIAYRRPDRAASRYSDYILVSVEQPVALKAALELTLGILVVVRKRRELWRFGATRIHLDTVDELGTFVELETVLGGQTARAAEAEHRLVRDALGLTNLPAIAGSYSDLLLVART